jgi:Na+/H+ antiporter NhaD/arsenite permease-like protein
VHFAEFFQLILPAIVNWLVPAFLMSLAIPRIRPEAIEEYVQLRPLALFCVGLFAFTIALSVSLHTFLHLPPVIGMMTGLGLLKFMGYYLKRKSMQGGEVPEPALLTLDTDYAPPKGFDIFHFVSRAEWDTLMFFYGVVLCVGGLATVGWLEHVSVFFYEDLGATVANTLVGLLSAIIDNVPMMLAVLTMEPEMNLDQWLLVTLTAGVGGSLLSIGSAAGVALMGQARGAYTFFGHLRWSWAILIGYFASIATHLWLSGLL